MVGADVNLCDTDGLAPLHWAAIRGHSEIAQLLLDSGATVDHVDKYGRTALFLAAEKGHLGVVRVLLGAGADVAQEGELDGKKVTVVEAAGNNGEVQDALKEATGAGFKRKADADDAEPAQKRIK